MRYVRISNRCHLIQCPIICQILIFNIFKMNCVDLP